MKVGIPDVGGKEICSCIDEEIQPVTVPVKRSRTLSVETERMSCCSEGLSCVSSDEEERYGHRTRIPTVILGQSVKSDPNLNDSFNSDSNDAKDPITLEPLREPKVI